MQKLNEYSNIEIDDMVYDKEDLIGLYRLKTQLLIEENLIATLEECVEIWQNYSNDLQASWLYFPQKDEDILRQIKSNVYFKGFDEYILVK